jgi:hypothetical protein
MLAIPATIWMQGIAYIRGLPTHMRFRFSDLERLVELRAGADVEFAVDPAEIDLHRFGADEQRGGDVAVDHARGGQLGDVVTGGGDQSSWLSVVVGVGRGRTTTSRRARRWARATVRRRAGDGWADGRAIRY